MQETVRTGMESSREQINILEIEVQTSVTRDRRHIFLRGWKTEGVASVQEALENMSYQRFDRLVGDAWK